MSQDTDPTAPPDERGDEPARKVTDHEYMGNVCSGFGGSLECEMLDLDTGARCGRSPYEHDYRPGKHQGPRLATDTSTTPKTYEPRHSTVG